MCMSSAEIRCRELYRIAVKARDKYCQVCGTPYKLECHHIVLVSKGNWVVQYDLDYAVTLCDGHHRGVAEAPHVSPEQFEEHMLPLLLQTMEPARAAKIQSELDHPSDLPDERPDLKAIRLKLSALIRDFENDYYCDADINQMDLRRKEHG